MRKKREVEADEMIERRDGERFVTIYRAGKLTRDGQDELCLIRNLSAGGAMLETGGGLTVGEPVILDLRMEEQLPGHVAWSDGERCGIAFDAPVDVEAILAMHEDGSRKPRAPRLKVVAAARLDAGDDVFRVVIEDLSQKGARIMCSPAVPKGLEMRLVIEGLGNPVCTLRWRRDGYAGLSFLRSLPIAQLNAWVREQRAGNPL